MITILMAVYNGEKYLAEQIESIINQTYTDWKLIICDDCSADDSYRIAAEYSEKYPGKIVAEKNTSPSGSAQNNFMNMLENTDDDYIMFSDQDDVWLPDKIRLTYGEMAHLEKQMPGKPILVHTELNVTDGELNVISDSFTRYSGFNSRYNTFNRLLVQNNITGCTTMINRRLAEMSKGADCSRVIMHDWWIGLIAAAFGYVGFVKEPTIMYRQHGGNQVGAKNAMSTRYFFSLLRKKLQSIKGKKERKLSENPVYIQARYFYERFSEEMPEDARELLKEYLELPFKNKLSRISTLIRYRLLRQKFIYALGQIVFC